MKKKNCKGCPNTFTPEKNSQMYCSKKCCKEYHKKIRRVEFKKGRYTIENAERRKPFSVEDKLKNEIYEFLLEIKRKCLFLDAVDSFRLVNYYIELFGTWYFSNSTIEEELFFYYKKIEKYILKEKNLEKI